jgi:NADH-quinone oxidoreductase subunit M
MPDFSVHTLTLAVLAAPAAAAAVCFLCGRAGGGAPARRFAIWFALLHLALTAALVVCLYETLSDRHLVGGRFLPVAVPGEPGEAGPAFRGQTTWDIFSIGPRVDRGPNMPSAAVQFFVGVDGLNLWLVPLASLITLAAVLLTVRDGKDNPGAFLGWLFALEAATLGAFLSFDAILFFAFFEITLIPAFFLIGRYGVGGARRDAARKFFLYTLCGGAFTFVGILGTVALNPVPLTERGDEFVATDASMRGTVPKPGGLTFSIPKLMRYATIWDVVAMRKAEQARADRLSAESALAKAKMPKDRILAEQAIAAADEAAGELARRRATSALLFFALIAGFAVKLPIVPLHAWLPAAYAEAPAGITMYLSAVLAKLGAFGLLRVVIPLCPLASVEYGPTVVAFAAVGIVYAALCAYAQTDAKRLAAYSSVSHLGLIVLGAFAMSEAGVSGAAFHTIAHGLSAGMMFGLLAFLHDRYGTLDTNRFGGLFARFPGYTFFFLVAALAGVGLPGLCNFVGEMLVIGSLFSGRGPTVSSGPAIAACAGVFLSAWYTFTLVRKVFFGPVIEPPPAAGDAPPRDVTPREGATFALLALGCALLGLVPQPVLVPIAAEAALIQRHRDSSARVLDAARTSEVPAP